MCWFRTRHEPATLVPGRGEPRIGSGTREQEPDLHERLIAIACLMRSSTQMRLSARDLGDCGTGMLSSSSSKHPSGLIHRVDHPTVPDRDSTPR